MGCPSGTAGLALAEALSAKDAAALRAVLVDDVDFRALTPRRHWSASTAHEAVDEIILGHRFEPSDRIHTLVSVCTDHVADCEHVAYRLRVGNADGDFLVEQQAYYTLTAAGRIGWMRLLCSGYRPVEAHV
jgi:hypothetical protein